MKKFRVWDTWSKTWYNDKFLIDQNGEHHIIFDSSNSYLSIDLQRQGRFLVQQFTGLTDKTGKELFEGDIVKEFNSLMVIEWHDGGFWSLKDPSYKYNKNEYGFPLFDYVTKDNKKVKLKIVGNIFENPELLK